MKITDLPLTSIRPYWRNPRFNEGAIAAVKESIEQFGFNTPIIVDAENIIIAGHSRYKAMQQLGAATIPAIILDLPPAKAKAYRIADNRTSDLSEWDWSNLVPELREIVSEVDMSVYYPDDDLDAMLNQASGGAYTPPTAAQINAADDRLQTTFETRNDRELAGYVTLLCPECGEEFAVQRSDILAGRDQPQDRRDPPTEPT